MNLAIGVGVLAILAFIIFGPFITIWALNVLFPALAIPYTWETYLAMIVVGLWFSVKSRNNN